MEAHKTNSAYRPDIDGLRTIAITVVILFHASFSFFSGGFVGVDIFFVISGYLITGLLFKELEATQTLSFSKFYSKRFKRLYPALVFLIVTVMLVWGTCFLGNPTATSSFIGSVKYGIFGFANVYFKKHTGGYFDLSSEEMPMLHFWSLAVEEQFYLVWPLLMYGAFRTKIFGWSPRKRACLILLVLGVFSFIHTETLLSSSRKESAFYYMLPRAWELCVGGLLYFLQGPGHAQTSRTWSNTIGSISLGTLLLCTVLFDARTRFPGSMALVPVFATCALIYASTQPTSITHRVLSWNPMVQIGLLSYGWYLWHWPLLAMLRIYFEGETPPVSLRLLMIALSLLLAKVSLEVVEKPFRFGEAIQRWKPLKTISLSLGLSGIIFLSSSLLLKVESLQMPESWKLIFEMVEERSSVKFGTEEFRFGAPGTQSPRVFLWGDSHAQAMSPMLLEFAQQSKINLTSLTQTSGLPILGIDRLYFEKARAPQDIGQINLNSVATILEFIKQHPETSVSVYLSARWATYVGTSPISVKDKRTFLTGAQTRLASREAFRRGLKVTIDTLLAGGVRKIVIQQQFPEFRKDISACIGKTNCDTPRGLHDRYSAEVNQIIFELASAHSQIRILDPAETFCDLNICPQILRRGNLSFPVVYDDDHVTVAGAKFFYAQNAQILHWLID